MTEKESLEILSKHGVWHGTDLHEQGFAKGYLEAREKARGLEEALARHWDSWTETQQEKEHRRICPDCHALAKFQETI